MSDIRYINLAASIEGREAFCCMLAANRAEVAIRVRGGLLRRGIVTEAGDGRVWVEYEIGGTFAVDTHEITELVFLGYGEEVAR